MPTQIHTPGTTTTRIFLCSSFLLSLEVKPKLSSNSETDATADRHEHGTRRMRNVPVHAEPDVHSGTHAHVRRDSGQQHIATAPALGDRGDAIILRMQPSHDRPDEPFTGSILRFIGPVRQPEPRFDVAAEACLLRPLRAQ